VSAITAAADDHAPSAVYIQALHQLFAKMQVGNDESRIVDSATGIRETQVWSKLYTFPERRRYRRYRQAPALRRLHYCRQCRLRQNLRGTGRHQIL
jgi:hypothetical protein